MKKIYSFVILSFIALTSNAQLVINENFTGYANGNLNGKGSWVSDNTGDDAAVSTTTPLTHPTYTSGFQYISINDASGKDPYKPFSTSIQTTSSKTVFVSFLIHVDDVNKNTNTYTLALRDTNSSTVACRFFVQEENNFGFGTSDIQFGIAIGNGTAQFTTTSGNWEKDNTYLIVIRYDIVNGGTDRAYLWVNPSTGAEPTAGVANTSSFALSTSNEVSYGAEWNALQIFQTNGNTPDADFDAFRVAAGNNSAIAWSTLSPAGAPLPVQLTNFNASEEGFSTKLVWNTVEENNLVSYVIEKSADGRNFTAVGTIKAAHLKSYSFTDAQSANNSYYRLKMVDQDGAYKYSYIVSVKAKLEANISLSPNPVKNSLLIQHPKASATSHVQIIGAAGQLLKDIRLSANAVISNVDMSGLASGLYHVVYKNGAEMFSKTVIKN